MEKRNFIVKLIRDFIAGLIRYERWKMNPKNMEKAYFMESYNKIKNVL